MMNTNVFYSVIFGILFLLNASVYSMEKARTSPVDLMRDAMFKKGAEVGELFKRMIVADKSGARWGALHKQVKDEIGLTNTDPVPGNPRYEEAVALSRAYYQGILSILHKTDVLIISVPGQHSYTELHPGVEHLICMLAQEQGRPLVPEAVTVQCRETIQRTFYRVPAKAAHIMQGLYRHFWALADAGSRAQNGVDIGLAEQTFAFALTLVGI